MEKLCRDVLTDPVRILVGELGEANTDITQLVEVIDTEDKKWQWLSTRLVEFTSSMYVCGVHIKYVCVYCVYACVCTVCVLRVRMCMYVLCLNVVNTIFNLHATPGND